MTLLHWLCLFSVSLLTCRSVSIPLETPVRHGANIVRVPVGGNSWVTTSAQNNATATITKEGVKNWTAQADTLTTYVRLAKSGTLTLSAMLRVPDGTSRLRLLVANQAKDITVQGATLTDQPLGQWSIAEPGYVAIRLVGVSKTGSVYAEITDLGISGESVDDHTAFVRSDEGNFFYWGRRGPSVHLRYPMPEGVEAEWFYNEITVPPGNDVIGSYYMANGFGAGYFGMQVNSATERRVLFSVWSPYQTDDPASIPADQRIRLDRKGANVTTNDFGNEGSGGQSYLRYNWVAGQTYQFLLRGHPVADGYTVYTAYFKAATESSWQLIASFRRPKTTTYLKSLHSFLENFIPETGNRTRGVNFSNQWIRATDGTWHELTNAQFTADNTARKGYRMDYASGSDGQRFFLRNCGFFSEYTPIGASFSRSHQPIAPAVDINALP